MEEESIDQGWIDNYFKNLDRNLFSYKEKIKEIDIFYLYLIDNEIFYFFKDKLKIDNKINNHDLINIIESHKKVNEENFCLKNILKFDYSIENLNIEKFINNENISDNKLEEVGYQNDIYFKDNINIFNKLSSLFFIYGKKNSLNTKNITFKRVKNSKKLTRKCIKKMI
jgi:hypothetical protein